MATSLKALASLPLKVSALAKLVTRRPRAGDTAAGRVPRQAVLFFATPCSATLAFAASQRAPRMCCASGCTHEYWCEVVIQFIPEHCPPSEMNLSSEEADFFEGYVSLKQDYVSLKRSWDQPCCCPWHYQRGRAADSTGTT